MLRSQPRPPRSTWIRLTIWISLIVLAYVLLRATPLGDLLDEDHLMAWLEGLRGALWAPAVLIGLYAVLAPAGLPMSPLVVVGAAFGAFRGTIYNTAGLFLGAATSFLVARYMGRDLVLRVTGARLRRAERFLDRHGFWPLVQTRLLPLPFPVVNFGAALAGVRWPLFLSASLTGLFPAALIQTVFISQFFERRGGERWLVGAAYVASFAVLNLVLGIPSIRERLRRRRRYRDLVAGRATRVGGRRRLTPDSDPRPGPPRAGTRTSGRESCTPRSGPDR